MGVPRPPPPATGIPRPPPRPRTAGIPRPPPLPSPPNLPYPEWGDRGVPVALGNIRLWEYHDPGLRGPAAILFISRDTCSDSIAELFRACFCGVSHNYRAVRCKMGYRTDVAV